MRCLQLVKLLLAGSLIVGVAMVAKGGEAHAVEVQEDLRTQLAYQLFQLSGWNEQVEQIPELVESILQSRHKAGEVSPVAAKVLSDIIPTAFAPSLLRSNMLAVLLAGDYGTETLRQVVAMLERPIPSRMGELERVASSAAGQDELSQFTAELARQPPSTKRIALVRRLNSATHALPFAVETTAVISEGVLHASEALLPQHHRTPPRKLTNQLRGLRRELERQLTSTVLVSQLYTYHAATDAELEIYLGILESSPGHWFIQHMSGAFLDALARAAESLVAQVHACSQA